MESFPFLIMKHGNQGDNYMILHLEKGTSAHQHGKFNAFTTLQLLSMFSFTTFNFCFSHLKTLTTPFNESVDKFLDKLRPLADGKSAVPMKSHLAGLTLDVISKVSSVST